MDLEGFQILHQTQRVINQKAHGLAKVLITSGVVAKMKMFGKVRIPIK